MSVYKFGKSLKKDNFIERVVTKNNNFLNEYSSTTVNTAILLGYIVDKPIELTYALLELQHLPVNDNNSLYWKDKKLTLVIGDINGPIKHETKEYIIRGGVASIKIPMLEYIEANKNIRLVLECSSKYTSRKPSDIIVNNSAFIALPFELASLKLYYDYK